MSEESKVLKFPELEYLLECNCGRTDFRLVLEKQNPLRLKQIECGCGEWASSLDEVLAAVQEKHAT